MDDGVLRKETMVRFEQLLPGLVERVWAFLTESDHLSGWLGGGTIEPRAGGAVIIAEGHIRGVVTQWKPPHRLAYTWNVFGPGEDDSPYPESYVTFELKPQGNEVLLTLSHRPILEGFEPQTLMGWHTILEMLSSRLHGEEPEPREVLMERNRARYGVEAIRK